MSNAYFKYCVCIQKKIRMYVVHSQNNNNILNGDYNKFMFLISLAVLYLHTVRNVAQELYSYKANGTQLITLKQSLEMKERI